MLEKIWFVLIAKLDLVIVCNKKKANKILTLAENWTQEKHEEGEFDQTLHFFNQSEKCQGLDKTAHKVVIKCSSLDQDCYQ